MSISGEVDRIHRVLDGELPRAVLSSEEEGHLRELERRLALAAATLREVDAPDLSERVLAALPERPHAPEPAETSSAASSRPEPRRDAGSRGAAASPFRTLWQWLWRPLPVAVRPAYVALAGAVVLFAATLLPGPAPSDAPPTVVVAPTEAPRLYVQFRIEVPGAAEVALAGSFTGWRAEHHLTEVAPGVWSIMLPLSPGVHDYAFVVDGERMVVDPYAPSVADPFGGSNSRLFLPAPNGSA